MKVDVPIEFSDRTELDQYLFSLLAAWSKELIGSGSTGDVSLARDIDRTFRTHPWRLGATASGNPSDESRFVVLSSKRLILESQEILRRAEQELVDASSVESRFEEEARQWQQWLTHVLHLFESGPALPVSSANPPNPNTTPVQDSPEKNSPGLKVKQKDRPGNSEKSLQNKRIQYNLTRNRSIFNRKKARTF